MTFASLVHPWRSASKVTTEGTEIETSSGVRTAVSFPTFPNRPAGRSVIPGAEKEVRLAHP